MAEATLQRFIKKHIWNPQNFTLEDPSVPINGFTIAEIFGGGRKTASGQVVTEDIALQFSAVWACVQAFSGPFSYFPVKLYRHNEGTRERVYNHPVLTAINQPLPYMTRNVMMERAMVHLKLWGNAYIEPIRSGRLREVTGFFIHHPSMVSVKIVDEGNLKQKIVYEVKDKTGEIRPLSPTQIIHIAGMGDHVVGKSTIKYAREDIGLEIATRNYGGDFFANGGKVTGLLSFKQILNPTQKEDAKKAHLQQKQEGGDLVLGADATYTPFSIPPEDAQFLGTRYFNVVTICRWFGVPPWKVAALQDGSTFRNIEEMGIAFLKDSMAPVVEKFETAFNNVIFGADSDLKLEFDMEAYLRADAAARAEQNRTGIQNAYKTPNEVREANGDNPIEGGDRLLIQSNMIPLDRIDDMLNQPETRQAVAQAIANRVK